MTQWHNGVFVMHCGLRGQALSLGQALFCTFCVLNEDSVAWGEKMVWIVKQNRGKIFTMFLLFFFVLEC